VNPDVELAEGSLRVALAELSLEPRAGVSACRSEPGRLAAAVPVAFPGVRTRRSRRSACTGRGAARVRVASAALSAQYTGAAPWVSGACMLVTARAVPEHRWLDEDFFLYGGRVVLRAHAAGFPVRHTTRARVLHHGGASGADQRGTVFVRNLEGRLEFLRRHRGAWRAAITRELFTLGALLRLAYWRLRALLERGRPSERTRAQLERFEAVWNWRVGRAS
jgi:GT2 family glycosyltransferase